MLNRIKSIVGSALRSMITDQTLGNTTIPGSELWLGSPTASGLYLTPEQSLTYTAVYAGVDILSSAIGSVKFNVVKHDPNGGKYIDKSHPLQWLVAYDANVELSARQLRTAIVIHLIVYGNCYIEIERDAMLRPVALWLLDPNKVEVIQPEHQPLHYRVNGVPMLNADIIHLSMAAINGVVGKSPLHWCKDAVGVGKALEVFAASFFANGMNARGVITIPDGMGEVEAENLRKSIMAMHGGAYSANKLLILENGATFTSTATPPNEAQMNEARAFQVLEICKALRLAPQKLQDYSHSTYSNIEEVNIDFYQTSLLPYIDKIEDEFNRKLFTRAERMVWSIAHDEASLLRGRMGDQIDNWLKLQQAGLLNPNEVRANLGYGPIPDGDVYLVPANNYQPLSLVVQGQTPAAPEPAKALEAPAPQQEAEPRQLPAPIISHIDNDEALAEAARSAVLDVARRMTKREVNAVRRVLRKGTLEAVLEGLTEHYRGEAELLAEAYAPSLRILSLATQQDIDPADFAKRLVEATNRQILEAVEGPDTLEVLEAMVEQWESEKPQKIVAMID